MITADYDLALRVRGLTKSYGEKLAVDGIDFDVRRGEVMALLGPNGAGKTSTVEICEGFLEPDPGSSVSILGLDPVRERGAVRERVGMMLQGGGAYSAARTEEMLRLVASFYADPLDVDWLLDILGMREHGRTPYRRLSGGQQQRLSLACAIVGRPQLVFFDEPTAGMDAQSRLVVWDLIRALRRDGVAVLLTTHLMDEAAELADSVVIIDRGSIVASGTPEQLSALGTTNGIVASFAADVPATELDSLAEALSRRSFPGAGTAGGGEVRVRPGNRAHEISIDGEPSPELFAAACAHFAERGLALDSIGRRQRSLEDVFLELTGKEMR